jgi:DNA polymerase eta
VCGLNKPNKQTVLPINMVPFLYQTLPVKKVRHLGGKLGDVLIERLGITYMWELEKFSEAELCHKFDAKNGSWLYKIARGIDGDPVKPRLIPKSIGCCKRFPGITALKTKQEIEHWICELSKEVAARLAQDFEEVKLFSVSCQIPATEYY